MSDCKGKLPVTLCDPAPGGHAVSEGTSSPAGVWDRAGGPEQVLGEGGGSEGGRGPRRSCPSSDTEDTGRGWVAPANHPFHQVLGTKVCHPLTEISVPSSRSSHSRFNSGSPNKGKT